MTVNIELTWGPEQTDNKETEKGETGEWSPDLWSASEIRSCFDRRHTGWLGGFVYVLRSRPPARPQEKTDMKYPPRSQLYENISYFTGF
jgi:hypothetical protein